MEDVRSTRTDGEVELYAEEQAVQEAESWLNQKTFSQVREEIYQRGSFTVCVLHAVSNGKEYEGVGFAKARQELGIARYDSDMGKTVSRGRAVHDLFLELKREQQNKKTKIQ